MLSGRLQCAAPQLPCERPRQRRLRRCAASVRASVEELERRALPLAQYAPAAVTACAELAQASLGSAVCDGATLEWFARDRSLDVDKTMAKASRQACPPACSNR